MSLVPIPKPESQSSFTVIELNTDNPDPRARAVGWLTNAGSAGAALSSHYQVRLNLWRAASRPMRLSVFIFGRIN